VYTNGRRCTGACRQTGGDGLREAESGGGSVGGAWRPEAGAQRAASRVKVRAVTRGRGGVRGAHGPWSASGPTRPTPTCAVSIFFTFLPH
jgi:hypothetical protein